FPEPNGFRRPGKAGPWIILLVRPASETVEEPMARKKNNAAKGSGRRKRGSRYRESVVPKIGPRLRMFADGDPEVNAIRSTFVPSLALAPDAPAKAPTGRLVDLHATEGPA